MPPLSSLLFRTSPHRRLFSTLTLPLTHPTYIIWAANTGLGKTLISTGLASSVLISKAQAQFVYLKPLQTGYPTDSDSHFLFSRLLSLSSRHNSPLLASNLILSHPQHHDEVKQGQFGNILKCRTLWAWSEAVSPHIAAERESRMVSDDEVREMVEKCLLEDGKGDGESERVCWSVVETAGGVASPGPSGTLQCDLYRPFRLPAVLVGDGRLGGISATISAYESLKLRGYDVAAIVLEDGGLANEGSLLSYVENSIPVLVLPRVPEDLSDDLSDWFDESRDVFSSVKDVLLKAFSERVQRLHELRNKAGDTLWWPFTQHQLVPKEKITVIDSRCGENFAVHKVDGPDVITQQFDACASWWTQGPDSALQIELAKDMGYAAARYGHVMYPENVYEPALRCAELLIEGVGKGWASRAFFSDNGSTAIEVALKMAFRKFLFDHQEIQNIYNQTPVDFRVLALKGSYHGDTLGAMEAQAPSPYTGFLQQPWYVGRGLFLDPPTVYLHHGRWNLILPDDLQDEAHQSGTISFASRDGLFSQSRNGSDISRIYSSYISRQLSTYTDGAENKWIAALIMEPVIHGAGGMHMVDPLFQRVLVKECRKRKVPVIFDEVFTGFWRLGVESAAELLQCSPDIACYAKLMTGGIIPLAATLATEDVFETFAGDSKLKALLHGHSYSAHAMGCTASVRAIKSFKDPKKNPNMTSEGRALRELWDLELVNNISSHPQIKRVVSLGTLFAMELKAEGSNAGYASVYAGSLIKKLREDGIYTRPLGNVIYLMCGPCTSPDVCAKLLGKLYQRIEEFDEKATVQ